MTRLVDGLGEVLESKPDVVETPPAETPPAKEVVPKKDKPRRPAKQAKRRQQQAEPAAASASPKPASHEHLVLDVAAIRRRFSNSEFSVYIAGTVPAAKLENARATYAPNVAASDVLLLYDDTELSDITRAISPLTSSLKNAHARPAYARPKAQSLRSKGESPWICAEEIVG